ncbi:MAG: hypothetical protein Q8O72_10065 [Bacteroidales bacterium]|nr:hypothetical protein [Bacteroidales bacterium]
MFSKSNINRRRNFWIAVAIMIFLSIFGCIGFSSIRNRQSKPAPAPAASATPFLPLASPTAFQPSVASQTPQVVLPSVTPQPETAISAPEVEEIVELKVPANYFPIYDGDGALKVVTYSLNTSGPHVVEYPYQSTLVWASGKFTLAGDLLTVFTGKYGFAEDIGDIIFDVCQKKSGCKAGSIGMTAGHAAVTIVFGGYEDPKDSLAWAINNMFDPKSGNCGSGCNKVYVGNMQTGEVHEYTSDATSDQLTYAVMPPAPYVKVSLVGANIPTGAGLLIEKDNPVGHVYYLTDKDAFVSVNEAGGTVIYCGAKCNINNHDYDAGTAVSFIGVETDGSTPEDLNYTIEIKSSDPSMIRVYLVYAGSFENQVILLEQQFPDWKWIE